MPSETNALLQSIRRWVLVGVILIGAMGMTVADMMSLLTDVKAWPGAIAYYGGFASIVVAALLLGKSVSHWISGMDSERRESLGKEAIAIAGLLILTLFLYWNIPV